MRLTTFHVRRSTIATQRPAFTLIELLVVIGIIALLAGILFPTIRKMRIAAQEADSRNLLNQIDQACQGYFLKEAAYPGPFSNATLLALNQSTGTPVYELATSGAGAGTVFINDNALTAYPAYNVAPTFSAIVAGNGGGRITGAENLVLGLCGGLAIDRSITPNRLYIDPASIGQGPINLNPAKPGRTDTYINTTNLSKGKFADEGGTVTGVDSIIPEFQDRFATPMPILYMRSSRQGVSAAPAAPGGTHTLVVGNSTAGDYNIIEIQPYTSYPTGGATAHGLKLADPTKSMNKGIQNTGVTYQPPPYDAYDYLVEPSSYDATKSGALTAAEIAGKRSRKKDSYVLISAGRDRIYGTEDDIVNFGSVFP